MKLIPILDESGTAQLVNPEFVTAIESEKFDNGRNWRKVWVVGHAGYHTFSIITHQTTQELKDLLEGK